MCSQFQKNSNFQENIQILTTYNDCGAQGVEQQMRISLSPMM
jgi:hypothetical protein